MGESQCPSEQSLTGHGCPAASEGSLRTPHVFLHKVPRNYFRKQSFKIMANAQVGQSHLLVLKGMH